MMLRYGKELKTRFWNFLKSRVVTSREGETMVSLLSVGKTSLSSPCEIDLRFSENPFTVIHNVISNFPFAAPNTGSNRLKMYTHCTQILSNAANNMTLPLNWKSRRITTTLPLTNQLKLATTTAFVTVFYRSTIHQEEKPSFFA